MTAAANAAAVLFIRKEKRLRDWQIDVDLHRLGVWTPVPHVPPALPRVSYRKRPVSR